MAYSIEVKNEAKRRLSKGEKAKEISKQMGISLATIYKWKKELGGVEEQEKDSKLEKYPEKIEKQVERKTSQEEVETSKEIKRLIKGKQFDRACRLTEKYPYNPVIQSQRIKILIIKKEYQEAKRIGSREEFINYPPIQSQMITIAIQEGNLEEAKRIGSRKEFINNQPIQSQMVTIAIQEGNLEEAKRIGSRKEYINNLSIQSQMVTIAIQEGNLEEAKRIGSRKEFINNPIIQSQMVTIAIQEGNLEEAKRIGSRKEFINNLPIQSQMVTLAIQEGNLEEAKRIGSREEFINYPPIQSQMITIAIQEGNLEEAKRIGSRKEFINNPIIQSQMEKMVMVEKDENSKQQFLNKIKTKLYYNKIDEKDIEEIKYNDEISEDERSFILLAIYEKRKNTQQAKRVVKGYKAENPESEYNKTFNIIMQRIENKKMKIFDNQYYDELLHWKIDKELKETYEQEAKKKKESLEKENPKVVVREKTKKTTENTTDKVRKGDIYAKTSTRERTFKERMRVEVPSSNIVTQVKPKKEANHFNEILEYLTEKRYQIYVKAQSENYETQKEGITQWDKMEILLEKVNQNKDNKEYMNHLYQKILQLQAKEKGMSRE